jgi:pimeloyl-ACP methyl ester carboxylesterase
LNNPYRFIWRIVSKVCLVFFISSTAYAVTVTYPEDMICSIDVARPDNALTLHQQIAQTANGPIGYYEFGQGSPLVLITGYRATLSEWSAYFLAGLATKHRVIVFDNRGIGQSAPDVESYRVKDLARDTAALVKALGFHSVTVLGWSMGGIIAQQLALDDPELVENLVLLNSAPPGRNSVPVSNQVEEVLSGRGDSSLNNIIKVLFPAGVVQRAGHCFVGDMFAPRDYTTTTVSADVTAVQERLMRSWALNDLSFARLHRTRVRTLVLSGTGDKVLVPDNSITLSKVIPHAKLVEVKEGGHAMMYQYPKALADEINTFIGNESPSL